jgi:hypothetical protein
LQKTSGSIVVNEEYSVKFNFFNSSALLLMAGQGKGCQMEVGLSLCVHLFYLRSTLGYAFSAVFKRPWQRCLSFTPAADNKSNLSRFNYCEALSWLV